MVLLDGFSSDCVKEMKFHYIKIELDLQKYPPQIIRQLNPLKIVPRVLRHQFFIFMLISE